MKILITGASGFVGKHLLRAAQAKYGKDNIFALTSQEIADTNCLIYKDHDLAGLDNTIFSEIDIVIHAGAFTPKNAAEANNIPACNSNIKFTESLLKLSLINLKKIINISTLDVYEPVDFISEQTLINPQSLYGLSKLYCERIIDIEAKQRGIRAQTLRLGHVYGPGEEKYQKMLPITIKNVITNQPIEIWGDGDELRSFIYIDDVIHAIMSAIALNLEVGPINIVGGHSISIRDLVKKIVGLSAKEIQIVHRESNHKKKNFVFDNRLLKETLLPEEVDFTQGLRAEYDYMSRYLEHHI